MVTADRIPPKGEGAVQATFNSSGRKGKQTKTISVSSNDPDNRTVQLKLTATIIPQVKFYLFYSKDCEECETVSKKILPPLERKYNLNIKSYDLDQLQNYELLSKFEEKLQDLENDIPVVIIGDSILGGPEEIRERLEAIIKQYEASGCGFPSPEVKPPPPAPTATKVYLAYFYSKRCKECDRLTYDLRYLERKHPNLVIQRFDMDEPRNKKLNEAICELYKVPDGKRLTTPMVFVGEDCLIKKEINRASLESLLDKYKQTGTKIPWEEAKGLEGRSEKSVINRFKAMSVFTVVSAGLIDGINPCAIATVLLLISFLSFLGKTGRKLLAVGTVFTSSVYVTYLLIGMGMLRFLRQLRLATAMGKAVFSGAAFLALLFGALSVYDYFRFRSGRYEEAKLKLPKFLKRRVDALIRERVGMRNYLLAAAVIGFLISITELVCTGQVYLPTIMLITEVPHLKVRALAYLLLYNLAFVIPLVVVFAAAYTGTTSMDLGLFFKKHLKSVKLITSALFFVLAGLLIFYAFH